MPATTPSITGIKATSLAQHIRAPSGAHHTRRPVGSKITRQNISTERKQAIATQFFESPYFALAGASQLRTEQGYKIFNWYHAHALPVTALNRKIPAIALPSYPPSPRPTTIPLAPLEREEITHSTLPSPLSLPQPAQTSLSVVTPPRVTDRVLRDAYIAGVRAVWLEPGAFDNYNISYARRKFDIVVHGSERIWSILDEGENAMRRARKQMWVNDGARREEEEKVEVEVKVEEIKNRRQKHGAKAQEPQSAEQNDCSTRLPRYSSL